LPKPKKPAAHPKYSEMVGKAIAALKERGGSSRQAILKYIMANFNVGKDAKTVNFHLKLSLRAQLLYQPSRCILDELLVS
jgi:histone H1/5